MLEDRDYMKPEPRGRGIGSLGSWTPVKTLFVANIAIFVIQHLVVSRGSAPFWLSEQFPAGGVSWDALREGRVWTLFTYMFVHSGFESNGLAFLHLLGNLLIIYVAGRPLQELLSQTKFYLLYFGGGIAGALLEIAVNWKEVYLIGASAGALALLIAFAASDPERRIVLLIPLPVELRLRTIGRVALIVSAVLGIATVVFRGSPNGVVQQVTGVAHFAHLGGGLFGLLFMRLQGYRDGRLTRGDILRGREGGGLWGRVARKPRPRNPPVERSRPREEVEYDAILDKMNRHGIQSLSESERAILERASERIRSREKRS